MPVLLNVRLDQSDIDNTLVLFEKKTADRLFARALNQTATQVRNNAASRIAKAGGFKAMDVRKAMDIHKARPGGLSAVVTATGRSVTLYHASRTQPVQTKRGVRANAWGKSKVYQGTFLAEMPGSGHVGIFRRKTFSRLPIQELFGPSIPRLMRQPAIRTAIDEVVPVRLRTNIARQVDRELRKRAGLAKR